eukprot:CAMPEP_0176493060 /NCGR_PEP_ID=MMETSP0200_2-20121128/9354_1 /TAXON_ID=947934 /ORGANISM="Chaetoceros sp., Strain GSL56" /LENGTH=1289 /DNA_ID=CAMNT_0017890711 /DNA_START=23 /DNA_END=3892 /DNA_ORIENTATION=-
MNSNDDNPVEESNNDQCTNTDPLPLQKSSSLSSIKSLDSSTQMPKSRSPRSESTKNYSHHHHHSSDSHARGEVSIHSKDKRAEANFVDVSVLRSRVGDKRVIKKATHKSSAAAADQRSSWKNTTPSALDDLVRKDSMNNSSITDDYLESNFGHCDLNHSRVSWEMTPEQDHVNLHPPSSSLTYDRSNRAGGGGGGVDETSRRMVDQDAMENASDHHNLLSIETGVNIDIARRDNRLSRKKRFHQGENVLVDVEASSVHGIIGVDEDSSRKPLTATRRVNKYGFPQGEGIVEEHKRGPYVYVLATVQSIHFGEDAIYYIVERFDNQECQRAQRGWMEPISPGSEGEKAAMRAAQCTIDTILAEGPATNHGVFGCRTCITECRDAMNLAFKKFKHFVERQAELVASGQAPYRIQFSFTTVNLFVICSLIVALLELFKYAFLPIEADNAVHVIAIAAWLVLLFELISAIYIRPSNYRALLQSDKAYAPSTVRYINNFHLTFELIALLFVIPDFVPLFGYDIIRVTFPEGAINATGRKHEGELIAGKLYFLLLHLRIFCLIRHLRNHWIQSKEDAENQVPSSARDTESTTCRGDRIGTALLLVNSQHAMILLLVIAGIVPLLSTGSNGGRDKSMYKMLEYLHVINLATPLDAAVGSPQCELFAMSVDAWLGSQTHVNVPNHKHFEVLIMANIDPPRCGMNGTITAPDEYLPSKSKWTDLSIRDIERVLGMRTGNFVEVSEYDAETGFKTSAVYNLSDIIIRCAFNQFMMQLTLFLLTIACLGFLRADASRLVLAPLRRMLKAIARFAENPLVGFGKDDESSALLLSSSSNADRNEPENETSDSNLGSYETEQITSAVTKITDLLQKCWGVAGAGIISSNLARNNDGKNTVVFNPKVPGKLVYAIFGFAGINDFSHLLRALDKDVMALINDVAKVVHNEVYRWGFGESGQCNKNLGSAFLMVYRIGDFEEVREKKARAANVFFEKTGSTLDRSNSKNGMSYRRIEDEVNSVQLASLPGISGFADRALLGFFKSYAGLNREKDVKKWESDYRLGAGVGAFSVEMSFGMDAGWAVEGAVGSIYKIDATYLSTHVNMASRMMSACKQYKVSILISQAMEEMLTRSAKKIVRHIDTVYAKGSSKKQRIYALDVRHQGADLFLHKRSETEANKEADNYSHKIWQKDQDLRDMRSHVTPEFEEKFKEGLRNYLNGNFGEALKFLKIANEIMIETVVNDGRLAYVNAIGDKLLDSSSNDEEVIHIRKEIGDGPSQTLIAFIEKHDGVAPSGWNGVRQLTNK